MPPLTRPLIAEAYRLACYAEAPPTGWNTRAFFRRVNLIRRKARGHHLEGSINDLLTQAETNANKYALERMKENETLQDPISTQ